MTLKASRAEKCPAHNAPFRPALSRLKCMLGCMLADAKWHFIEKIQYVTKVNWRRG
jgi:hypothetical protein